MRARIFESGNSLAVRISKFCLIGIEQTNGPKGKSGLTPNRRAHLSTPAQSLP